MKFCVKWTIMVFLLIAPDLKQTPPSNKRCTFGYPQWNKRLPLINTYPPLSAALLNTAHIRIVTIFYQRLNWNTYGPSIANNKTVKILWIFRFFHYIWFIDRENLNLTIILKEKMTRFWHLILFISLTWK